jgi:hypothetical protein
MFIIRLLFSDDGTNGFIVNESLTPPLTLFSEFLANIFCNDRLSKLFEYVCDDDDDDDDEVGLNDECECDDDEDDDDALDEENEKDEDDDEEEPG